jgi:hypothetical protein
MSKRDVRLTARESADHVARRRTGDWQRQYNAILKDYEDELQNVLDLLRRSLHECRKDLSVLQERHNTFLARGFDDQLVSLIGELRETVEHGGSLVAEVKGACERETASIEAVRQVWTGTMGVKRHVYRRGVPLGGDDRKLAHNWARGFNDREYDLGGMESARCAELVALGIYRDIYGDSEDLSIRQEITPSDMRWLRADIAVGVRWIDVKNARRSFSPGIRRSYSEHCVAKFKSDRLDRHVIISGFLSEYIGEEVIWLGETSLGEIESLRSQFKTAYLELDFSDARGSRIPPWLFEYPSASYAERDAALATVRAPDFVPPRSECPLGFLVLAGRLEQLSPNSPLSKEVLALAHRIPTNTIPTRPLLFLHVLDRFCQTVRDGMPFPSWALRRILFSADSDAWAKDWDDTTPLAVLDPLKTVKELLDVLERIAATCAQQTIAFTRFKLTGSGIFRGCRPDGKWQTIFAYCGGWGKLTNGKRVKCGQNPLFIGQNDPCDNSACGKLKCHSCGYCCRNCPLCSSRQASWLPIRPER